MKRYIILGIVLVAFILIANFVLSKSDSGNVTHVILNGNSYRVLTARNEYEWAKGLMFVRELKDADGMLFIFPDKQSRTFWNQNTFVDLNLYWMDDDKVVGVSYLPSIEKTRTPFTVSSPAAVNRVVELIRK